MSLNNLSFASVPAADLDQAIDIEKQGFPPDEAATIESFRLRQHVAPDLFLGAYCDSQLVGYVCSTLSPDALLTHASMSTHVPGGSSVCIHSVCVSPACKRKGVGLQLLREYVARLEEAHRLKSAPYRRILLITHGDLRSFYEQAGFEWVGPSAVVHGSQPWFEMRRELGLHEAPPQGLYDALQRPSNINPQVRTLSSFSGGIADVSSTNGSTPLNKFDLLCPRHDCGSVILKSGVAKLQEAPSVQLEPIDYPSNPLLPALPAAGIILPWWLVSPSAMEFENIGFSRPIQSLGAKTKLLTCAECDLGPLGWCEEGGTEFWLACSRVGYRL